MYRSITTGVHHLTEKTTDQPGAPFADVRAELSLDIGGDAVVHLWSNARVFAYGKATVYVYGNAHVFAFGEAQVFFFGEGRLESGGHAHAHVSSPNVFVIAIEHAKVLVPYSNRVLAYGDSEIEAGPDTQVSRNGYAIVKRGEVIEGPPTTYRGGYIVVR